MKKRYTRRNEKGIKTKSTLLTGLEKMQMLQRRAVATHLSSKQNDWEKTLTKMSQWLSAVEKCPPRHYGKVWNDEKEVIVNQCRRIYEKAQKYFQHDNHSFMGNSSNLAGPSDRYISMDRLRWNMGKQGWDYTHEKVTSKDQYWQPPKKPAKCVTLSNEWKEDHNLSDQELAYLEYEVNLMKKRITTGDKLTRTVGWTPGRFAHRIIEWT